MNPRFNPLLKPSGHSDEPSQAFKLKMVPAEKVATPFKSLSSVLADSNPGRGGRTSRRHAEHHEHEPKIELKRDGNTITRITVICGCGSVMEIECDYGRAKLD